MNPWMAVLIFFLSVADDILVVFYMRRVVSGRRGIAGLLSGALTALISAEVVIYSDAPVYIPFNAVGSVVGTWLAIMIDEKWPPPQPRDKQGKYKTKPPKAEALAVGLKREGE